ncbi:peroxide/acid stress response protein YhcN [Pantoea sp. B65]|uniref:peroxide/acid stress response protein YhcN n=1 Tax=Pantoea sp. B65 TaxID=2813359 RepID=UPI0039B5728C
MNVKTTIATLSILSALSFGAFAAESITAEQAQNMQPAGMISVSGIAGAPTDMNEALVQKADQQGAKAYRVVEAYENGNWHATAELYK